MEMIARDRVTHNLFTPSSTSSISLQQVIACEDYSTLSQLLQVTAYVLHFIKLLKNHLKSTPALQILALEPEEVISDKVGRGERL